MLAAPASAPAPATRLRRASLALLGAAEVRKSLRLRPVKDDEIKKRRKIPTNKLLIEGIKNGVGFSS